MEGRLDEFPVLISCEKAKEKNPLAWTRFGGRERDRYGRKKRISVGQGGRVGGRGEGHLERRSTVRIVSTHTGGSPTTPPGFNLLLLARIGSPSVESLSASSFSTIV